MTIDEAIELEKREQIKCENDIGIYKRNVCKKHSKQNAEYHRQLAEWLEDYKQIKMLIPIEQALKAEYNKALDDIVTIIKERVGMDWEWDFYFIEEIAEQLKEGGMNEYNI